MLESRNLSLECRDIQKTDPAPIEIMPMSGLSFLAGDISY
jgi:hypothetical protein